MMAAPMIFLLVAGVVWVMGLVVLVVWQVAEGGWEGVGGGIVSVGILIFFIVVPWAFWYKADYNLREANQTFVETYEGRMLKFDNIELKGWRYQWVDSEGQYHDVDAYFREGAFIYGIEGRRRP